MDKTTESFAGFDLPDWNMSEDEENNADQVKFNS